MNFRLVKLNERKTEHFKALNKKDNTSAIAEHVNTTAHNITWGRSNFDILANGKTDYQKYLWNLYISLYCSD